MARSNKPILWLPFAAGGLVSALVIPVLIAITGVLLPLGLIHLTYANLVETFHKPIVKIILFGVIALSAWHAAHRMRTAVHDLRLGGGVAVKAICYGFASLIILAAAIALLVQPAGSS